jgi:RNA polymerase sigma factor (sigma-70 family)
MAQAALAGVVHRIRRLVTSPVVKQCTDQELVEEFHTGRDQTAFAALVDRHGPLVLRVCRHVLGHEQDAEDAFQATFLVLARRAGSIRKRDALAAWLHGVAHRIAMQAKRNAARRRAHEARALPPSPRQNSGPDGWREVQAVLDDEIQRLPDKYRAPFVLCFLEGHGRAEVARQLRLKEGTVWSRLSTARRRLQARLARRGIELGAAMAAAQLAEGAGRAAVPVALGAATVRVATTWGVGTQAAGVSAEVAALVQTALGSVTAWKAKIGMALLLLVGAISAGAGAFVDQGRDAELPAKKPAVKTAAKDPSSSEEAKEIQHLDRYGDPLPAEALARLGTVRFRQGASVHITRFTPDGKSLLLGGMGAGPGLSLWDVTSGRKIRDYPIKFAIRAAISPDGNTLAVGESGTGLWELSSGRHVNTLGKEFVAAIAFGPDGTLLAAGGQQGVNLWDVKAGKKVHELQHGALVRAVVFASGGKVLVSAGEDGTARLWEVASGKELRRWDTEKGPFQDLAASSTSPWVALADEKTLRLFNVESGKEVRLLGPNPYQRGAVAFSPDGKVLASAQDPGTLHLWDPATGKETHRWKTKQGSMFHTLIFSPDGKTLVWSGHDGSGVHWWDVAGGKEVPQPQAGHGGPVTALGFSRDGKDLLSLGTDGHFMCWNTVDGKNHGGLQLPICAGVTFSPDGKKTLSIEWNGKVGGDFSVRLRDSATGKEIRSLGTVPMANVCAFSADGKNLALAEYEAGTLAVSVWDVDSGKRRHRFTRPGNRLYFCLAFSPDGKKVAAGSWAEEPHFRLWDLTTGKEVPSCEPNHWVNSIAFSSDGNLVALGSGGDHKDCVSVWKLAAATELRRFPLPGLDVVTAFSPSGRFLAAGGKRGNTADGSLVQVWEITTGKRVAAFEGKQSSITSVGFAPDGKGLASGGGDSTILIWDLIGRLRHQTRRPLSTAELDARWQTLLGADAAEAYKAVGDLVTAGDAAVACLKARLSPVPVPDAKVARHAAQLVADLNSDAFAVRQKAALELEKLANGAVPALRKALAARPSLETRRRVEQILAGLEGREAPFYLRKSRALEALELIATPAACDLLRSLSRGDPTARLTQEAQAACNRLARLRNN